jgi:hypothetical protein
VIVHKLKKYIKIVKRYIFFTKLTKSTIDLSS